MPILAYLNVPRHPLPLASPGRTRGVSERQRLPLIRWRSAATTASLHLTVAGHPGGRMSETNEAAQTARAKDQFFSADMHMFHITGFP
jgi:hypothetical protein